MQLENLTDYAMKRGLKFALSFSSSRGSDKKETGGATTSS
jgi:hypothetical protein